MKRSPAQPARTGPATVAPLECRELALGRVVGRPVLTALDLTLRPGELIAVLGPSGAGKTTLLHAIAGFAAPLAGEIWLGGRMVSSVRRCVPPEDRAVGVVFQHYALWPHLSVLDTVGYPVRRSGAGRAQARREAAELLDSMQLADLAARRPAELSGGEQQRVALARALARRPSVYLFDEPTAHLDAHLRGVVLDEVADRRRRYGAAALYATHDAAEALAIADRVLVLCDGRLAQLAEPAEIYARPADLAVARLTGPVSVLTAAARPGAAGTVELTIGGRSAAVACDTPVCDAPACDTPACDAPGGRPVSGDGARPGWLVRPDWVRLDGPFRAVVRAVRFHGPHTDYQLETPAGRLLAREPGPPGCASGTTVSWSLSQAWPLHPGEAGDAGTTSDAAGTGDTGSQTRWPIRWPSASTSWRGGPA